MESCNYLFSLFWSDFILQLRLPFAKTSWKIKYSSPTPILYNTVLDILASTIKQENKIKCIRTGNKEEEIIPRWHVYVIENSE